MAKAITEVAIGAAAIGAAFLVPGAGIAIGSLVISHAAAVGALSSIAGSEVMAGLADALKSNQGGLAVGVTTPIGPWGYVYGTQKVGGIEIFRESNNNTGASGSTSNNKQLHRVYVLACHPCSLGSWQLRIDGKQVLLRQSGPDWVSYSPSQIQYNITSISRTNGVVTMQLSGSMPAGTNGSTLQIRSVANNSFNGTWTVTQPNPADFTTFTFVCGGPDTSSSGGNARTTYSDYKDKIRVCILNGNHTSTFPTLLAAGTTWKASDLCLGRTVAYVQMGYDDGVFPSSIPNVSFVIDGKNDVYDPRTGTRGFTKNPALCIADFLSLAPTLGGFGLVIGTDIPTAQLIAAANCCDEQVLLNAGGYTSRYTCNTFFQLNMTRGTILKNMLSSCAGRITYQGGQYAIVPGAWVAPTLQLTDSDMVGGIKWNPRFSVRDTCNAVKGTYVSPENAYQQADIPAYMQDAEHGYVSDTWLAEDNGERIFKEANFPCTDSSAIAQRLAKIALLRTRFQGRGTIRCSLKAYQAVALDVIQITHPHYTWLLKNFEVLSSRFGIDKNGDGPLPYVELDIAETDPSIYDWTPTEQLTPQGYMQPNNVGARICTPPEQVTAYSGTGATINGLVCPSTITTGADGRVQNSIYVAWVQPNDAHVMRGGHMEVRWQSLGALTGNLLQNGDFSGGASYWTFQGGWVYDPAGYPNSSGHGSYFSGPGSAAIVNNTRIDCTPGDTLTAAAFLMGEVGATGTCVLRLYFFDSAGNMIGSTNNSPACPNTYVWTWVSVSAIAPVGALYALVDVAVIGSTSAHPLWRAAIVTVASSALWNALAKIDPSASSAFIPNVTDGASYNVQVRAVNCANVPSDWIAATPTPVVVGNAKGTLSHVVTITAGLSGDFSIPNEGANAGNSAHFDAIPGLSFSVTANGPGDVFNIQAAVATSCNGWTVNSNKQGLFVCVDGNTSSPAGYGIIQYPVSTGTALCVSPVVCSITGLSAGTHTIAFYVSFASTGSSIKAAGTLAACQHVF